MHFFLPSWHRICVFHQLSIRVSDFDKGILAGQGFKSSPLTYCGRWAIRGYSWNKKIGRYWLRHRIIKLFKVPYTKAQNNKITSLSLKTKCEVSFETSLLVGDPAETTEYYILRLCDAFLERWHLDSVEAHGKRRACSSFRVTIHDRMWQVYISFKISPKTPSLLLLRSSLVHLPLP